MTYQEELNEVIRLAKSKITGNHFMYYVHSLHFFSIYNNKDFQKAVCDEIEKLGYSVRVGLRHNYYGGQGLQEYVFECSKNTKFNYVFTDQYNHEILEDSNLQPC